MEHTILIADVKSALTLQSGRRASVVGELEVHAAIKRERIELVYVANACVNA